MDLNGGINISNNKLSVSFGYLTNTMGINTLSFRYQDKNFILIGYDTISVHRPTGDTRDESFNFLTEKCKVTKGNIGSENLKEAWGKYSLKQPLNINQIIQFKEPFGAHCPTSLDNDNYDELIP